MEQPRQVEAGVTIRREEHVRGSLALGPDVEVQYELRVRGTVHHDVAKQEYRVVQDLEVLQGGLHVEELTDAERLRCEEALHDSYEVANGRPAWRVRLAMERALGGESGIGRLQLNCAVNVLGWRAVTVLFQGLSAAEFAAAIASLDRRAA